MKASVAAAALACAGCRTAGPPPPPPPSAAAKAEQDKALRCAMLFHKAHMTVKRAEWLARSGKPRQAVTEYDGALSSLGELRRIDPKWNRDSVLSFEDRCRGWREQVGERLKLRDLRASEAIARFEARHAADPESSLPYASLADFYFSEGEYATAMAYYKEALRRDSGNIGAQINVARIYSRIGDNERAMEIYRRIIDANPDIPVVHYNLAGIYFRSKKPTFALREYARALELDPAYAEAHNAIGLVYKQLRQYDQAIAHFKNAVELAPDYAPAYQNLGLAFMAKNNYPTALNYLRRAIELFGPESPRGRAIAEGIRNMHRYR